MEVLMDPVEGQASGDGGHVAYCATVRWMKRTWLIIFILACSSLFSEEQKMRKVTLQLQWSAQTQFAGYYAAAVKGFYQKEGLNVTIRTGGLKIVPQDAVSSGQAEFCVAWLPKVLVSIEQGADLVNIAQIFQRNGTMEISWKDSGIKRPADWKGKKIGTWGNGNEIGLFAAMKKAGINPKNPKDVTIVEQTADMNLFLERKIDAAQAMIYNEYYQVLQAQDRKTGKSYTKSDISAISMEEIGTGMPQDGIYARSKWLADGNDDVAVGFLRASRKGWFYCQDHAQECVDIVTSADPKLDRKTMQWMMQEVNRLIWDQPSSEFGIMTQAQWDHAVILLLDSGILKYPPSAAAFRRDLMYKAESDPSDVKPSEVFQNYEDVLNRHDARAVASFWVLKVDASELEAIHQRWKGERAFESATNAGFAISSKHVGADAYEITQREDCDFYRELGTGTKISKFTIHLRDKKFHDVQRGTSVDTGGSYDQAKSELKAWILKNHPEVKDRIFKNDDFEFNGDTASTIMKLVREWRKVKLKKV